MRRPGIQHDGWHGPARKLGRAGLVPGSARIRDGLGQQPEWASIAIFLFFIFVFYKNIFLFSKFTEIYSGRPVAGRPGSGRPAAGFCAKFFAKIFTRKSLGAGRPAAGRPALACMPDDGARGRQAR